LALEEEKKVAQSKSLKFSNFKMINLKSSYIVHNITLLKNEDTKVETINMPISEDDKDEIFGLVPGMLLNLVLKAGADVTVLYNLVGELPPETIFTARAHVRNAKDKTLACYRVGMTPYFHIKGVSTYSIPAGKVQVFLSYHSMKQVKKEKSKKKKTAITTVNITKWKVRTLTLIFPVHSQATVV